MGINISKVSFTYNPKKISAFKKIFRKKKYKNVDLNEYVLDNVSLNIKETGEFISIVGHTGSGKSTLIQLMNALLPPTKGKVTIFGNELTNTKQENLKEVRKNVGLVFQFPEYQLFEETVLKDVEFGPKNFGLDDFEKRAKDALNSVGLDEKFYDKSPFRLSGGEKRKVAISGILASNPNVLILDEPTVGLDPQTKNDLVKLLKQINKEKTVIIVTHDMNVLWEVSSRVIVVDEDKIVYDGDKYSLFKNEEFVLKHSLDIPDVVAILKKIKQKYLEEYNIDLPINIYQDNLEGAYSELLKVLKYE